MSVGGSGRRQLAGGFLALGLLFAGGGAWPLVAEDGSPAPASTPIPPGPEPLWISQVDGPLLPGNAKAPCGLEAGAASVAVTPDGTTFMAGLASQGATGTAFVAAYDSAGVLLWVRSATPGSNLNRAPRLVARDSGEPRVALVAPNPSSYEVIAYASNGTEMWRGQPDGSLGILEVKGAGFTSSGAVVVASRADDFALGVHVARFGAAGLPDWQLTDPALVLADGARVAPGDDIVVWGGGGGPQQVARYQIGGGRSWLGEVPQPASTFDRVFDVALDDAQRVFGTGDRCDDNSCALLVFSFGSSGGFRWDATTSPGLRGTAIAVGLSGEIYVAGTAAGPGGTDGELARFSAGGVLDWHREIDRSGGEDALAAVALRGDGAIQAVGTVPGPIGANDDFLVATATPAGDVTSAFLNLASYDADERGCGAVRTPTGGLTVIGQSDTSQDVRLAALTGDAVPIWSTTEPPLESPDDSLGIWFGRAESGGAISIGPAGDLWLAAESGAGTASRTAPTLIHLDSSGQRVGMVQPYPVIWSLPSHRQMATSVVALGDGGAALTGVFWNQRRHGFAVRYDSSLQAQAVFEDQAPTFSIPIAIFQEPDESFRLAGVSATPTTASTEQLALDSGLQEIWRSAASDLNSSPTAVVHSSTGDVWEAGISWRDPAGNDSDCHVVGFDSSGTLLHELYFGEPAPELESCSCVAETGGRVVVGGSAYNTSYVGLVASFGADGQLEWSHRGEFPAGVSWQRVSDVAPLGAGRVVIAGSAAEPGGPFVLAVAGLEADGQVTWVRLLDAYTTHFDERLAVDSDGFIFLLSREALFLLAPDGVPYWARTHAASGLPVWGAIGLALDGQQAPITAYSDAVVSLDIFVSRFPPRTILFRDGFETGDSSRWSLEADAAK